MLKLSNLSFGVTDGSSDKEIIRDVSLSIPENRLIVIT